MIDTMLNITTRKYCFYNVSSTTILENRFRIWCGDNFVIRGTKICFYVVHSKAVIIIVLECDTVTFL